MLTVRETVEDLSCTSQFTALESLVNGCLSVLSLLPLWDRCFFVMEVCSVQPFGSADGHGPRDSNILAIFPSAVMKSLTDD